MSWDPKTNRQEREAERAQVAEPPPLEPPFPYVKKSFDPFLFGVTEQPPPMVDPFAR